MAPPFDPELTKLFRDIRDLEICWPAIVAANSHVTRANLSAAQPLESVFLPWFTFDGAPVCHVNHAQYPGLHLRYPQRGDLTVTVGQAAAHDFRHPWMSEVKLKEHQPQGPVKLKLPAYDVGSGYLLLDGAHRSIATLRAAVDYDIELAVIHGPIDHRVLRDLIVFE